MSFSARRPSCWAAAGFSCVGESRVCVGKTQLHAASIAEEFAERAAAVSVVDAFGRVCVVGTLAGLGVRC